MKIKKLVSVFFVGIPMLLVVGCGGSNDSTGTGAAESALAEAQVVVLDARRQDIYDTNCAICHSKAGTGAPQSGKLSDWQERSGKGMEAMLNNAMDGFQTMPAMGGCFDCTEEDFRPLITFMTSGVLE